MLLLHDYRLIFIKTNKTAGTSVEIALSKHAGPDDVITPIAARDERKRQALGYRGPQNYRAEPGEAGPLQWVKDRLPFGRFTWFYNHMSAREIRDRVPADVWNGYVKVAIERNPFDRLVSYYYWRCQSEPRPPLDQFMASTEVERLKRRGIELYTIDGEVVVDRFLYYHRLAEDLEALRLEVGIPEPIELPRTKAGHRADKRPYREVFCETSRAKAERVFAEELELHGFSF